MYLLNGYLGYGNYGDELLAELVSREIKKRDRLAEFKRLSSKNTISEHFSYINQSREVLSIGGLFQDSTGFGSVIYYFTIILLAKVFGKRVKIIAQGIGPLNSWFAKALTFLAFKMADSISVRDKQSSQILKNWSLDHYFGSDLAWILNKTKSNISEESKSKIQKIFSDLEPGKKLKAISLRSNKKQDNKGLIDKLIDGVLGDYAQDPVVIFQMQDVDFRIHNSFNEIDFNKRHPTKYYLIEANKFSAEENLYILENYCSQMVAMRLHALILARIAGLEIVAIASDPKIREFREQIDVYSVDALEERASKHII